MDIDYIANLICHHEITILDFTPSLLRIFLKNIASHSLTSVRQVFSGGELLEASLVNEFHKNFNAQLFNQYGVTEATIDATFQNVKTPCSAYRVSIGKAISGVEVFVLNQQHKICSIMAIGEIYIGGIGLAVGYWNDPKLTSEKFIYVDTLGDFPQRLYKTGDKGRFLTDGTIDFLGRNDTQTKLNGIRIELQEIESIAQTYPNILHALAFIENLGFEQMLVLCIEVHRKMPTMYNDFQSFLAKNLPNYMIPGEIRILKYIPKSPSGKCDRKQINSLEYSKLSPKPYKNKSPTQFVTKTERTVAKIFADVLLCEQSQQQQKLPSEFNFFKNGGNSLQAIQVLSRLRSYFKITIPASTVFTYPVIKELAARIDSIYESNEYSSSTILTSQIDVIDNLPLSQSQACLWKLEKCATLSATHTVPIFYKIQGKLDLSLLQEVLKLMVKRHDTLRTLFYENETKILQKVTHENYDPLEIFDISDTAQQVFSEETKILHPKVRDFLDKPFDVFKDYCFRASLWIAMDNQTFLIFSLHKLIYDGHSDILLSSEVNQLYSLIKYGKPILPVGKQYADFIYYEINHTSDNSIVLNIPFFEDSQCPFGGFVSTQLSSIIKHSFLLDL